jgi:hypothetical protein
MAFVGGDITEITVNHPTIGTKTFFPKAGESFTYDLGGVRSNDDEAGITGSGDVIRSMNNTRASIEGPIAWDANDNEEIEFLNNLAADPVMADWTVSWINGTVYGFKGFPAGPIQGDTNAATIALKVSGSKMKKISG